VVSKPPFSYEPNPGIGGGFRIKDDADNRVATCYVEDNARMVTFALNALNGPVEWSCGHTATAMCATCWGAMSQRGHVFVEIIDALLDHMDSDDEVGKAQRTRLTSALHGPISDAVKQPQDKPADDDNGNRSV
jgi:hypothetical protein